MKLYRSFIKDLLITQGPKQREREDQGSPGEQPQGRNKKTSSPSPTVLRWQGRLFF